MSLQKKQVFNMPAFIDAVTQLIKDGYTINKHHTRATYGGYYSIAYEKSDEDKSSVAEQATIEADKATLVPSPEDNQLQQATDSLQSAKETTAELAGTLSDEDKATFVEAISREDELKAMTVKELREVLKERGVQFAPAHKEVKLIELILSSD